jgi:redox-sensing transcriptional repressor
MKDGKNFSSLVSAQTIRRLPCYLKYLRNLSPGSKEYISAASVADGLGLYEVLVRKDLAFVSKVSGTPRLGFKVDELIIGIEYFLGYDMPNRAVLAGAGRLGTALLHYGGFAECGLEIVAAFDVSKKLIGREIAGKKVFPLEKSADLCARLNASIGILTVPAQSAQDVCDTLVGSGVQAIWNFAPVRLKTPGGILVQNESMAESLAILSNHLTEKRRSS